MKIAAASGITLLAARILAAAASGITLLAARILAAAASGITLLAARILAAAAPGDSVALPALPLALLGLGWNFGLVSSTAITSDTVAARVSGLGAEYGKSSRARTASSRWSSGIGSTCPLR